MLDKEEDRKEIVELKIEGMNCANCAKGIEKRLGKIGIENPSINFADETLLLEAKEQARISEIIKEIKSLGFKVYLAESEPSPEQHAFSLKRKFLFCLVWTVPLLLQMFVPYGFLHNPWLQLVFCIPVFTVGLIHFGRSALMSLRSGMPNMDVLIIIGISASFIYSLAGTLLGLGHNFLFYETAATITTVVLLGNLIEKHSVQKTTSAIGELSRLQAKKAKRLIEGDGREAVAEIDSSQIKIEDKLLINTGDIVPADGEVYWGNASVNESMLSGESLPVEKAIGSQVVGGSILVSGSIKIRSTAVGKETAISKIIQLVKEAQLKKPAIQRIGDKVGGIFVPIVLTISVLTLVLSYFILNVPFQDSLLRAIAVLVISCPCAMGLATPSAIMVAIGRAAKNGILIRGGSTLEELASVKTIILDKTGTLSTGSFQVKIIPAADFDYDQAAALLLGLEKHSSHPIARSLVAHLADKTPAELSQITETGGIGISGQDQNGNYYEAASAKSDEQNSDHDLCLKKNGNVIAWIDLEDQAKPHAVETVSVLKRFNLKTVLLSGDSQRKCESFQQQLGIDFGFSEKNPEEKLEIIAKLEQEDACAFVGDGINDAPSLAQARVGVSLSDASDVAVQSAQVVLLSGDLRRLIQALSISKLTLRTIKQNLFWAFFYNVLAIPVAAAGYLNPMIAALAMAFSDVIVVGNSLRLKKRSLQPEQLPFLQE